MTARHVVVIGGGITGLSAAVALLAEAHRGGAPLEVTVLEAGREPGGHARTLVDDG